ncbi:MAG: hypothetical protein FD176_1278 [Rhodospirillaceae bacterium]|nr:MAG: hypothetical protein FD176_1278 [Rhodospirillaceae bacterium]TNC94104.1 MAG: Uncharacterized protein FD119_3424 [Stygiobacter sp.]
MKTMARLAIPALAALLLAGCGNTTSLPQTQSGDPQQQIDFGLLTDIPIPSGATMDNERSLILGDKDRWTGRVVMKLWKSSSEATAFYLQQMPAFNWEPIMAATSGTSVMSYVRGDRAATVQVEAGTMWGATVRVTVAQRVGTGATAPSSSSYAPAPATPAPVLMSPVYSEPLKR